MECCPRAVCYLFSIYIAFRHFVELWFRVPANTCFTFLYLSTLFFDYVTFLHFLSLLITFSWIYIAVHYLKNVSLVLYVTLHQFSEFVLAFSSLYCIFLWLYVTFHHRLFRFTLFLITLMHNFLLLCLTLHYFSSLHCNPPPNTHFLVLVFT